MIPPDPLLERLAQLPVAEPDAKLSAALRAAAHARLRPRRVHPGWALAVAASVITYLTWAVRFANGLY